MCFDFPSCILSKIKKGFNASVKFPAVKEKSAAFTGSCLGGKLPRPSRAHPAAGQGPPAPALFVCSHFAISRSAAACATCPGAAKQGAFPSQKAKNAGCQCFVFLQTRRPIAACATWDRRSRLHLLGVCGMINTAQALGPRKGRGGAPCRDRRGRYGT